MTDTIADMLTRIRNAARAHHESVEVLSSRVNEKVARILVAEGYLQEVKRVKPKVGAGERLRIQLRYDRERNPIMSGLKRVSRPGLRIYVGCQEIPPVRRGLGVNILSTSKGIMVDREAQKAHLGGEILCSVW